MTTARSKKMKGANFEKILVELFKQLDPKAYRIFGSGAGLQKGDIYCPNRQWLIECKNHKHLTIVKWLDQVKLQANDANLSMLVFKNPKSADVNPEPIVCISFEDLIRLCNGLEGYKAPINEEYSPKQGNRELQYTVNNAKVVLSKLLKLLE